MIDVQKKIQTLRASGKKYIPSMTWLSRVAGGCYVASAVLGTSGFGWPLFVIAVAASFAVIFLVAHTNEQESLADVLEYLAQLESEREKKTR